MSNDEEKKVKVEEGIRAYIKTEYLKGTLLREIVTALNTSGLLKPTGGVWSTGCVTRVALEEGCTRRVYRETKQQKKAKLKAAKKAAKQAAQTTVKEIVNNNSELISEVSDIITSNLDAKLKEKLLKQLVKGN